VDIDLDWPMRIESGGWDQRVPGSILRHASRLLDFLEIVEHGIWKIQT
jgi:hypothetical protein